MKLDRPSLTKRNANRVLKHALRHGIEVDRVVHYKVRGKGGRALSRYRIYFKGGMVVDSVNDYRTLAGLSDGFTGLALRSLSKLDATSPTN